MGSERERGGTSVAAASRRVAAPLLTGLVVAVAVGHCSPAPAGPPSANPAAVASHSPARAEPDAKPRSRDAYPDPIPPTATHSVADGGVYTDASLAEIAKDYGDALVSAGLAMAPPQLVYAATVEPAMAASFGLSAEDIAHESPTDALIVLSGTFSLPTSGLGAPLPGTATPSRPFLLYIIDRYSGSVTFEALGASLSELLGEDFDLDGADAGDASYDSDA